MTGEKNLLFLAYYFPPMGMGGVQRAAKFARYLPEFGWTPHVVTVKPVRYYAWDESLLEELRGVQVHRTGSLDPARLAYLFGRFLQRRSEPVLSVENADEKGHRWMRVFQLLFYPDSKRLWLPFARRKIRQLLRTIPFDAVFSTSPPVSAHLLAAELPLPWIADFRDYWTIGDAVYAPQQWQRRLYRQIMRKIAQRAFAVTAVSEPIADSVRRFARQGKVRIGVLPNGFDPEDFRGVEPKKFQRTTLVYSGNLNPRRSPEPFFAALKKVLSRHPALGENLQILFVGRHFGIPAGRLQEEWRGILHFIDYLPHRESLAYLLGADALLFFLSPDSAPGVVTGKIFEYLASGKPILALLPKKVAAYELLKRYGRRVYFAEPDRPDEAERVLQKFLQEVEKGRPGEHSRQMAPELQVFNRREQTRMLARLLDESVQTASAGQKREDSAR